MLGALYDVWCAGVDYDIGFYLLFCEGARDPVIELGAGTGRVAVELCRHGHAVIALDGSPPMLAQARARADRHGVGTLLETVHADLRSPPLRGPAECVIAPFRTLMHLHDDAECATALQAAAAMLAEDGRIAFDVFEPSPADISTTDGRWIERESGIRERARWDVAGQRIALEVVTPTGTAEMTLRWRNAAQWDEVFAAAGVQRRAAYAAFDGIPLRGRTGDQVYVLGLPERRSS